jgi:tetratricopeptide (TPR) repeat protein
MAHANQEKSLIFGSYNRRDLEIVQRIKSRLHSRGIDLWLDTEELLAGMEWIDQLESVIHSSRAAVIFKGPYGFGNFQRQEVSVLFNLHADHSLVVIPALLPGASGKNAGMFLGNIQHVDFRLRSPDPLRALELGLMENVPSKAKAAQAHSLESGAAHPLVRWIVDDMDNLTDIDNYGRQYIKAKRWPEALCIYRRLANLAIGRSNRAYADSYLQIGRIYFLAGERDLAEKKWEISLRIYRDYFPNELCQLQEQLNALKRIREAAHVP